MDHALMKTFLVVTKIGCISRAAEELFVSQSAVGKRIKQLEKEVGAELFARGKGQKKLILTAAGEAFVPLAERWHNLWSDMQEFNAMGLSESLSIGIIDSITAPLFVPLFDLFCREAPTIRLRIVSKPSVEMYTEIENRQVDVAFTLRLRVNPYLNATPLFSEPMVVLRPSDTPCAMPTELAQMRFPEIPLDDLDPDKELFIAWDDRYQMWHEHHWCSRNSKRITLNSATLLTWLINDPSHWAIVPLSMAYAACKRRSFTIYTPANHPPQRVCYQLTHKQPKQSALKPMQTFDALVQRALEENLPWAVLNRKGA